MAVLPLTPMAKPIKVDNDIQMLSDYSRNVEAQAFKRQWTVEDLMAKTGLSRNTIDRIRSNRHKHIDAYVLGRFMEAFDVTPDELLLRQPGLAY
jgi:DNA-binding Xre family transcriptional regulator